MLVCNINHHFPIIIGSALSHYSHPHMDTLFTHHQSDEDNDDLFYRPCTHAHPPTPALIFTVPRKLSATLFLVLLIRDRPRWRHRPRVVERIVGEPPLVSWLQDLERTHQTIVHGHHCT